MLRAEDSFAAIRISTVHSVEFAASAGEIETLEGRVPVSPGDAIVTGVAGEKWPVAMAEFKRRYDPVPSAAGSMLFRRRAQRATVVELARPDNGATVQVHGAILHGQPGDFRVSDGDGTRIVARAVFARTFVCNRPGDVPPTDAVSSYERFERDLALVEGAGRFDPVHGLLAGIHNAFNRLLASRLAHWIGLLSAPLYQLIGAGAHRPRKADPPVPEAEVFNQPDSPFDPETPVILSHNTCDPLGLAAEKLATRLAGLHRGAIVSVHLLGACAVTLAVLPYAWPALRAGAGIWVVGALEALALLTIIGLYRVALRWRVRWLDYRALAEGCRYADIGIGFDPVPGAAWWQIVLNSRMTQVPAPAIAPGRLIRAIREQQAYHQRTANLFDDRYEQGHRLSLAMFGFSALGCLLHLGFHWDSLLMLTAALPAFSAALHGALGSLELEALASASRRAAALFSGLLARAEPLAKATSLVPQQRVDLDRIAAEFVQLVAIEVHNWHGERTQKSPSLP